ncbi:MAG: 30S ribosomal protein S19 [Elusimicrobia bacterium CG1_02_63_36]|nr:MAG: 30S ribosomal protein S19 [Elusimicrobia bacterium CG1_02_63_36]PIP85050.1 MAG: 30S ribosomal protein S19 [Elusimicrobia bacterium CG22_combo_CG10-13_8_21_14_all_63_91]PJA12525.1 MAG: 30S ribosomal protein S19 [Elusimicrobia bacterium CG_4_10_14_0_2_um_filter_63_34]PJB25281.1 MAG: 30S ribosomal protein S19 [Elusimicrobia bacterium CG_4_9_14_3_um_filter_62_55]
MSRSTKKGPYIDETLLKKVQQMNEKGEKKRLKVWCRSSTVTPEMVGHTFDVHNGRKFLPIYINEQMVGHKLGEFSFTRFFKGHSAATKESKSLK